LEQQAVQQYHHQIIVEQVLHVMECVDTDIMDAQEAEQHVKEL